jgi:hypothetical protein
MVRRKTKPPPFAENTGENTADRCPESLRPYRWQKGQPSPNPGGRPKRAPISDAYARHVENPLPDDLRRKLRLPKGASWADAMALGQLRSAVKGNTVAAKEIADRIEGRVTQPISWAPTVISTARPRMGGTTASALLPAAGQCLESLREAS